MKKVRNIKVLLVVLIFLCGLKEFVNAALIRNALTVSMHVLEVKEGWQNILYAVTILAASLCIFPIIEHLAQMQKTKLKQYYQKKSSQEVLDKYHKMEFRYFDFVETYNLCDRTTKVAAEKMYQSNIVWFELMQSMIVVISLSYLTSIDPVTESEIFHRFRQLTKNCCSIIISHRIGAARIANRILVRDHGKLVEDGCHKDLIAKNGIYQRLYQMQAQWYS